MEADRSARPDPARCGAGGAAAEEGTGVGALPGCRDPAAKSRPRGRHLGISLTGQRSREHRYGARGGTRRATGALCAEAGRVRRRQCSPPGTRGALRPAAARPLAGGGQWEQGAPREWGVLVCETRGRWRGYCPGREDPISAPADERAGLSGLFGASGDAWSCRPGACSPPGGMSSSGLSHGSLP